MSGYTRASFGALAGRGVDVRLLYRAEDADAPFDTAAVTRGLQARSWVGAPEPALVRSEEHTSELQSQFHLVCRLLLEKKNMKPQKRQATMTQLLITTATAIDSMLTAVVASSHIPDIYTITDL